MKHLLPLLLLLIAACSQAPAPQSVAQTPSLSPVIEAVLSAPMPRMAAQPIPEARASKEVGDPVLLQGRIMGVMAPFIENRAVFILGENGIITPCSDMATDHCETPWDACCDPSETRVDGTASIQIVDDAGNIIKQGLEGVGGLEKLSTVTVFGTVAPGSSPESLLVNAQAIQVGIPEG